MIAAERRSSPAGRLSAHCKQSGYSMKIRIFNRGGRWQTTGRKRWAGRLPGKNPDARVSGSGPGSRFGYVQGPGGERLAFLNALDTKVRKDGADDWVAAIAIWRLQHQLESG